MIQFDQMKSDLPIAKANLKEVGSPFDLAGLRKQLEELSVQTEDPEFWNNPDTAQNILKKKKSLETRLEKYESLEKGFDDMEELMELAEEMEDEEEADSIVEAFGNLQQQLETLKLDTLLSGKYDHNNAIISVHAGTGGVDAMDWAQMLYRMYVRWSEKKGYKVTLVDMQDDTEAGIKSATLIVEGENAYGYLKNEKGVHRLVRISPFNSAGKRQTSFAALEVMPEIEDDMSVEIDPEDLRIDTYRSSGAGGQHVNKTDSAIRITHLPTHIVVTCQNERSQHQNKEMAMKILASKLMELKEQEHKENLKELKGDFSLITWGSQIRSYVFQPYTMVKDHRTGAEVGNVGAVMDGDIDYFINEKLKQRDED
ncbi:peptide chain release factor 2 [Anaerovoracaceae bacterium 41-7]|uniref:peptide chain release factor 2 n=1 Tax=Anaerovoracaceae TaxID=543314 RepID=UPI00137B4022|nr:MULTISPECIES: peptide chain release factor 2 [Clostridia]MCI9475310.1 peptide chain release factor 2 [Emergencia sp.]MCI9638757.1 peptide chain release factor 2 [Emergencia sp.]NCF00402.1 peptide chain release factor 2 [Emergencia sp. 1XD21-10]